MNISIEKVMKKFRNFASSHQQISTFEDKPISENVAKNISYPLMFIDLQGMTASFQTGQVVITLPVYMLDRVDRQLNNLEKILSERLMVMDDFYTYFTDNECEFGFYFDDNGSATPVIYEFDDFVAGYTMNISMKMKNRRNESQIPM